MIGRGSKVAIRGKESSGTVLEVKDRFANVSTGSQSSWHPVEDLTDISDRLLSRLLEGETDDPLKFILAVDANRLMTKYQFDPYVLASSTKITIYPHQIQEVIWGLDNQRIMIADEVGLGKTIIAALIASELKARGLADRVLYVVPKSLVLKWQDELRTRFDTEAEILDSNYVKVNSDPFSAAKYDYITSMDFLKFENRMRLLRKLDLVVIDEVHKLKPGNDRYVLGEALSDKSSSMIFLTATPHDGKDENFLGRMTLLDPFVSDVPSTSHLWKRHVKEDVVDIEGKQIFPERKSTTVDMELKNSEREIHRMLDEYISDKYEEVRSPQDLGAVRFFATILRKRATSSLRSLRSTLERRREKIGAVNARKTTDPDDMENDGDYEDRAGDYEYVYTGGDVEREKIRLAGMISAIDGIGETDSKFDNLVEYVEKVKSGDAKAKILLFTEYRDTLEYLDSRLSGRYRTGRIDGTMDMVSRKDALDEFSQESGPEILLCTDAAGEGIDMQFCNIEFNYDIPWNPNRLEQRMGRIHRIGQNRNVSYYNFVVDRNNTIDGMILGMLLDKIENIKTAMNDSVFDILGRIIGEDMISKIYEELRELPRSKWEARIMAKLDEIERTKDDMKQKTAGLMAGHKLDQTMLEDIRKIRMHAIDAGDVRRFLESWTEYNSGRYEEHNRQVRIVSPRHMASRTGAMIYGTLDGQLARRLNMEYLALGNRKVQTILADAIGEGSVAALGHPKKGGILCAYNRSVTDGNGRRRNSETVLVFCNEDGTANGVDAASIWLYEEAPQNAGVPLNTTLLLKMKELADRKMADDSREFHEKTAEKLERMRRKAGDVVDRGVATEIEMHNAKIEEWEKRRHAAPHYPRLIRDARAKQRKKKEEGDRRKDEIDHMFKTHLEIELIGIATVTPQADANARTMSDRAGMKIVMEYERGRARNDRERSLVRDVSDRDKGYDIETSDRFIEVKSFEGSASPSLTSHEWQTAGKFREQYWLYVVENVHLGGDITRIHDPHKKLAGLVTKETKTVERYLVDWTKWKRISGSMDNAVE